MMRSRSALALGLLALLGCALAPSGAGAANRCAAGGGSRPDEGGIGGTGLQQAAPDDDAGGIGGTGLRPQGEEDDSGVGGTGISAGGDTGVIGTITGFASICVGGIEIHYDAGSRVRIDGRAAPAAELAVGQVVEVVASGTGDELSARRIGVTHVVAGPITRVDGERNEIDVIGQTVRLSARTRGAADGDGAAAGDFTPGAVVRVSGLRQADGSIAASRIAGGAPDVAWVSGAVTNPTADEVAVAGTPVRVADGGALTAGEEVRVSGRWDGDRLVASRVDRLSNLPFDGRLGRLEVEGYASAAPAGQLRVGRYVFDLPADTSAGALAAAAANDRVRVEAVIDNGRAVIEHVGAAPPLPPRPDRSGDPIGMRPMHQPPPDGGRPGADLGGPAGMFGPQVARPDRPDRPGAPGLPDRPPPIDRPPRPDRVGIPERPPRIDRPVRPERPGP